MTGTIAKYLNFNFDGVLYEGVYSESHDAVSFCSFLQPKGTNGYFLRHPAVCELKITD